MSVAMAVAIGVLVSVGVWLVLQRLLSRIVLGIGLLGHAANLVLLGAGGAPGRAPVIDDQGSGPYSDPLPQALALTAIVITFGITAFLLALALRSWRLTASDEVEDDVADRLIAERRGRDA
jgi:multicomponent Na+:H+ antiporter subunit C